ncbi:YraN family protein [Actinokineospora iranica]|uniref:UPF0102 protein SAMN05216174_103298 n=1 Tax=Actinokineospora iranica TaxID=1271860 RepID=A0A1G6NE03_9PSEU|nr:YraN family protein [Actinokineospora iranica]SDC65537.1 putative endonuclease [Actinokineospora iranica]
MTAHLLLGRRGEDIAARYLENSGYVILGRNWRCELGELDLVCEDGSRLVVCEVKTRSGTGFGTPAESVTDGKATRIRRLATRWRVDHGIPPGEIRFDIVSVVLPPHGEPQIRHLRGAF